MIPTDNHSSRSGARVRLVVLHTTEGARTVESLGRYFQTGTDQASYHAAFDDRRAETYVDYGRAAWALRKANPISDNAAFCAFAAWTRAEWLRHPRMLELAAQWVAQRCAARGVPIRRLTLAEAAACVRDPNHPGGVIMHRDYTWATRDGTHHDCGDHLPWNVILTRARELADPQGSSSTKKGGNMLTNHRVTGRGDLRLICPVGNASAITARAWVSATVDGPEPGQVAVWFQDDDSGISDLRWTVGFHNGRSDRKWAELPDGTTQINIAHDLLGDGTICLETESR